MNDQTPISADAAHQPPHQPQPGPSQCPNCGAALHGALYFCHHCGKPYKDIGATLGRPLPPVLSEGDLIERKAPHVATLFWTFFAVVLATAIFSALTFQEQRPDLELLTQITAIFLTTCVFAAIHRRSLLHQLKRPGFDSPWAYAGIGLLIPALALNFAYHAFITELVPDNVMPPMVQLRQAGMTELTLIVVFCIYPAIVEEIAFRGMLQHWLQNAIKPTRALVLAAALFAVVHFSIPSFPYLFLIGLLLGWTKLKTGSLYPAMLIHFLHNLAVVEGARWLG